jgi:hypothetical protein
VALIYDLTSDFEFVPKGKKKEDEFRYLTDLWESSLPPLPSENIGSPVTSGVSESPLPWQEAISSDPYAGTGFDENTWGGASAPVLPDQGMDWGLPTPTPEEQSLLATQGGDGPYEDWNQASSPWDTFSFRDTPGFSDQGLSWETPEQQAQHELEVPNWRPVGGDNAIPQSQVAGGPLGLWWEPANVSDRTQREQFQQWSELPPEEEQSKGWWGKTKDWVTKPPEGGWMPQEGSFLDTAMNAGAKNFEGITGHETTDVPGGAVGEAVAASLFDPLTIAPFGIAAKAGMGLRTAKVAGVLGTALGAERNPAARLGTELAINAGARAASTEAGARLPEDIPFVPSEYDAKVRAGLVLGSGFVGGGGAAAGAGLVDAVSPAIGRGLKSTIRGADNAALKLDAWANEPARVMGPVSAGMSAPKKPIVDPLEAAGPPGSIAPLESLTPEAQVSLLAAVDELGMPPEQVGAAVRNKPDEFRAIADEAGGRTTAGMAAEGETIKMQPLATPTGPASRGMDVPEPRPVTPEPTAGVAREAPVARAEPRISGTKPPVFDEDPVDAVASRWTSSKSRNSTRAEKDLDSLGSSGHDVGEARDALDEYRGIERSDFEDAADYSEARTEAWDNFVDSVDGIERLDLEEPSIPRYSALDEKVTQGTATPAEEAVVSSVKKVEEVKAKGQDATPEEIAVANRDLGESIADDIIEGSRAGNGNGGKPPRKARVSNTPEPPEPPHDAEADLLRAFSEQGGRQSSGEAAERLKELKARQGAGIRARRAEADRLVADGSLEKGSREYVAFLRSGATGGMEPTTLTPIDPKSYDLFWAKAVEANESGRISDLELHDAERLFVKLSGPSPALTGWETGVYARVLGLEAPPTSAAGRVEARVVGVGHAEAIKRVDELVEGETLKPDEGVRAKDAIKKAEAGEALDADEVKLLEEVLGISSTKGLIAPRYPGTSMPLDLGEASLPGKPPLIGETGMSLPGRGVTDALDNGPSTPVDLLSQKDEALASWKAADEAASEAERRAVGQSRGEWEATKRDRRPRVTETLKAAAERRKPWDQKLAGAADQGAAAEAANLRLAADAELKKLNDLDAQFRPKVDAGAGATPEPTYVTLLDEWRRLDAEATKLERAATDLERAAKRSSKYSSQNAQSSMLGASDARTWASEARARANEADGRVQEYRKSHPAARSERRVLPPEPTPAPIDTDKAVELAERNWGIRLTQKSGHWMAQGVIGTKGAKAAYDISLLLRQGAGALYAHPAIWWDGVKKGWPAWADVDGAKAAMDEINTRPNAGIAKDAGLPMNDIHGGAGEFSNEGVSAGWIEKMSLGNLPKIGSTIKKGLTAAGVDIRGHRVSLNSLNPGEIIASSGRQAAVFMNTVRAYWFDSVWDNLPVAARSGDEGAKRAKDLAKMIAANTGSGSLKEFFKSQNTLLNMIFFAPRFVISRPEFLARATKLAITDQYLRKEAIRELVTYFAGTAAMLGFMQMMYEVSDGKLGGKVDLNPNSGTFGNINIGPQSYDPWGGNIQIAKMLIQTITAEKYSSSSGRNYDIDRVGPSIGGKTYGPAVSPAARFLRGKAAPVPSMIWDQTSGRDFNNDPVKRDPLSIVKGLIGPLSPVEMAEAYKEWGLRQALGTLPSYLGIGVNVQTKNNYDIAIKESYKNWQPKLSDGQEYPKEDRPANDPLYKAIFAEKNPDKKPEVHGKVSEELRAIKADKDGKSAANDAQFRSGKELVGKWKDDGSRINDLARVKAEGKMEGFIRSDPPKGSLDYWVASYIDTFVEAEDGNPDYDATRVKQDAWLKENGGVALSYVNDVFSTNKSPERKAYIKAMQKLGGDGYFDREKMPHYDGLTSGVEETELEKLEVLVGVKRNPKDAPALAKSFEKMDWAKSAMVILENEGIPPAQIEDVIKIHAAQLAAQSIADGRKADSFGFTHLNGDYFMYKQAHPRELAWLNDSYTYDQMFEIYGGSFETD